MCIIYWICFVLCLFYVLFYDMFESFFFFFFTSFENMKKESFVFVNLTTLCYLFSFQDREKLLRKKRHKRSSRPIKVLMT